MGAFVDCIGLDSIAIPNAVISIGNYAFQGCSGLKSVKISDSVTSIGVGTFRLCSGLTSIVIPNAVTSIGDRAFYQCSQLTSVTIPRSVTSIGESVFLDCTGLTSVTCRPYVPATLINGNAFNNCHSSLLIYVPSQTLTYYQSQWSVYKDIIRPIELNTAAAIDSIRSATDTITNAHIRAMADAAVAAVKAATTDEEISSIMSVFFSNLASAQGLYAEAKTELLGEMATPCTDCTAVEVTDGTTTVTLYKPTKVSYIKK